MAAESPGEVVQPGKQPCRCTLPLPRGIEAGAAVVAGSAGWWSKGGGEKATSGNEVAEEGGGESANQG